MNYNSLVDLAIKYEEAYYNGTPEVTDEQFDQLLLLIETLEKENKSFREDSPTRKIYGKGEVNLPVEVFSLDKVYDITEVPKNFSIVTPKIDGICALWYKGKLYTRGNGTVGQDISRHIPKLDLIKVPFPVIGEITKHRATRNEIAGWINSTNIEIPFLNFVAHDVILEEDYEVRLRKYPNHLLEYELIDNLWVNIKGNEYATDGLVYHVASLTEERQLGYGTKAPKFAIALKPEMPSEWTKIEGIEWTIGRNGQVTPVALLEPVMIDGRTVQRVSLGSYAQAIKYGIGDQILIEMRIIPTISQHLPGISERFSNPGYELKGNHLVTTPVLARKAEHFMKTLGIKGWGPVQCRKFTADKDSLKCLLEVEGVLQPRPLHVWITAMGFPGIGEVEALNCTGWHHPRKPMEVESWMKELPILETKLISVNFTGTVDYTRAQLRELGLKNGWNVTEGKADITIVGTNPGKGKLAKAKRILYWKDIKAKWLHNTAEDFLRITK